MGRDIESNQVGKGRTSTGSSCEGGQGPNNAFTRACSKGSRNRRRSRRPMNRFHIAEAPTPSKADRVVEEGKGLKIVH